MDIPEALAHEIRALARAYGVTPVDVVEQAILLARCVHHVNRPESEETIVLMKRQTQEIIMGLHLFDDCASCQAIRAQAIARH